MRLRLNARGAGLVLAGTAGLLFIAASPGEKGASASNADRIERGRYLVELSGCNDCHSPKVMSPKGPALHPLKLLSGHQADAKLPEVPRNVLNAKGWIAMTNSDMTAWAGPWGISFAANLTSDPATGIGGWTEQLFITTMRTGKHHGTGRQILPPMPWENYAKASDQDLKDIFAYLKSVPPVRNLVPQPIPPTAADR